MYVCVCAGVSEKTIKQMVRCGKSTRQVMEECNAGKSCGACVCDVRRVVQEALTDEAQAVQSETSCTKKSAV
jgi:bacterioferritin-associated ferredoxin